MNRYNRLILSWLFIVTASSSYLSAQTPGDAALCFYNWYLQAIKGSAKAHTAVVIKGANGETVLDYTQYFHNLDALGCVSDSFKRTESLRFQSCQDYFKETPYFEYYEYIDNYPNHYDLPCPFFTKYFWVETLDFWMIDSIGKERYINDSVAEVPLTLKSGDKRYSWLVTTVKQGDSWQITQINRVIM